MASRVPGASGDPLKKFVSLDDRDHVGVPGRGVHRQCVVVAVSVRVAEPAFLELRGIFELRESLGSQECVERVALLGILPGQHVEQLVREQEKSLRSSVGRANTLGKTMDRFRV